MTSSVVYTVAGFMTLVAMVTITASPQGHRGGGSHSKSAVCDIVAGHANLTGQVEIAQPTPDGEVTFDIAVLGFPDVESGTSTHGFHVHETDDTGDQCTAAGGHYNPVGVYHGDKTDDPRPDDERPEDVHPRHIGDLGNINQTDGEMRIVITDDVVSLSGEHSIINKTIVIHARADDLGRQDTDASRASGDAGARYGCCIIRELRGQGPPDGDGPMGSGSSYISTLSLTLITTFALLIAQV